MSSIGFGNWPDWIAAGGTLLAVIFAGFAARAAIKTSQQQARQLEILAAEQRRLRDESTSAQASAVAVWWKRARVSRRSHTEAITAYVINTSRLPIYNCSINAKIKADGNEFRSLRHAWKQAWESAPDAHREWNAGPLLLPHPAAQIFQEARIDTRGLSNLELARLADDVFILVSFTFRDAKGVWWLVSSRGDLEPIQSPMKPRPDF